MEAFGGEIMACASFCFSHMCFSGFFLYLCFHTIKRLDQLHAKSPIPIAMLRLELQAMMQSEATVYRNSKDLKEGKEEVITS